MLSKEAIKKVIGKDASKSKKMVELYDGGVEIKQIAELMGVRYNFVYNVVSDHCRKSDVVLRTNKGTNKKDVIRQLINDGKTNVEISTELKCSYNYVYNTRKEHEKNTK